MAATLTYIKSRMLLPTPADDEQAEEDPRTELVQQLVEYQRFREVAVALGERNVLDRDVFVGGGEALEGDEPPALRDASLVDLLDALREVLQRIRPPQAHEVQREPVSMHACVARILAQFALGETVEFGTLFDPGCSRGEVIVTFLALLELIRLRVLRARQGERFGPIVLALAVQTVEEAAARARDLGDADEWRGGGDEDGDGTAGHQ